MVHASRSAQHLINAVIGEVNFLVSDYAIYQDLMHRTNICASLFALHWLTRTNYGKPWLEDRSNGRPEPPHT